LEQKLADPDPEERARSVEALVQRREPHSLDAVLQALEDGDALVRNRALDAAVNSGLELPEDRLIHLVQFDPAPEVRFLALAGLAARLGLHSDQDPVGTTSEVRAISERA
jgi:HEAT repeat protein